MNLKPIHQEILDHLKYGRQTLPRLTERSVITTHQSRIGAALRDLIDIQLVELVPGRHVQAAQEYRLVNGNPRSLDWMNYETE